MSEDKNQKPDISNAEFEVLDALWDDYPATSADIIAPIAVVPAVE